MSMVHALCCDEDFNDVALAASPQPDHFRDLQPTQYSSHSNSHGTRSNPAVDPHLAEVTLVYMLSEEHNFRPLPEYFSTIQRSEGIRPVMRQDLVEWIAEVCDHYGLTCLSLAVNIVDRFLSVEIIVPRELQLFGAAALLIASKLKDDDSPTLSNICACAANAFDPLLLQKAESAILHKLHWRLQSIVADEVFEHYLVLLGVDKALIGRIRTYGMLFIEMSMLEPEFLHYSQSVVAASAVLNAFRLLNLDDELALHKIVQFCARERCPLQQDTVTLCRGRLCEIYNELQQGRVARLDSVSSQDTTVSSDPSVYLNDMTSDHSQQSSSSSNSNEFSQHSYASDMTVSSYDSFGDTSAAEYQAVYNGTHNIEQSHSSNKRVYDSEPTSALADSTSYNSLQYSTSCDSFSSAWCHHEASRADTPENPTPTNDIYETEDFVDFVQTSATKRMRFSSCAAQGAL